MIRTDLHLHVPVDRLAIHRGPSRKKCKEAIEQLRTRGSETVELIFTLTTLASETPFRRSIEILTISDALDGDFSFTAKVAGREMVGVYNTKTKKGWLERATTRTH